MVRWLSDDYPAQKERLTHPFMRTPIHPFGPPIYILSAQRFDAVLYKKDVSGSVHLRSVLGTLTFARAGVAHIGRGLAQARGLSPKHTIKQVGQTV